MLISFTNKNLFELFDHASISCLLCWCFLELIRRFCPLLPIISAEPDLNLSMMIDPYHVAFNCKIWFPVFQQYFESFKRVIKNWKHIEKTKADYLLKINWNIFIVHHHLTIFKLLLFYIKISDLNELLGMLFSEMDWR